MGREQAETPSHAVQLVDMAKAKVENENSHDSYAHTRQGAHFAGWKWLTWKAKGWLSDLFLLGGWGKA